MVPISRENPEVMLEAASHILAYDIGGSHITAGLCLVDSTTLSTTLVEIAAAPLPATVTSDKFVSLLVELGRRLMGEGDQAAGVALAFPAPFDYEAGISHMRHKLESLYGVSLKKALADRLNLGQETVHFLNDADAALLGEIGAGGVAQGSARVVGIMLGTGIGFSYVQDGSLNVTAPGVPPDNEIWNLPFRGGIVEDSLSSRALEHDFEALTGKRFTVRAIAEACPTDADAQAVFTRFGAHLGDVIHERIAPLQPDVVVFGGGISRSSQHFLPAARTQLNGYNIRLIPSLLREKAPLLGAAKYWFDSVSRLVTSPRTLPAQAD